MFILTIHYLETPIPMSGSFSLTDNDTKFIQNVYETYWNRMYASKKPQLITICFKWNLYNAYLLGYVSTAYTGSKILGTIVNFNGTPSLISFDYRNKTGQAIKLT